LVSAKTIPWFWNQHCYSKCSHTNIIGIHCWKLDRPSNFNWHMRDYCDLKLFSFTLCLVKIIIDCLNKGWKGATATFALQIKSNFVFISPVGVSAWTEDKTKWYEHGSTIGGWWVHRPVGLVKSGNKRSEQQVQIH
jgi:hypothetical protein